MASVPAWLPYLITMLRKAVIAGGVPDSYIPQIRADSYVQDVCSLIDGLVGSAGDDNGCTMLSYFALAARQEQLWHKAQKRTSPVEKCL